MSDYFEGIKKKLESKIPDFDSPDFKKMKDEIRKELKKKENDLLILVRSLKVLVLGDWYKEDKKDLLIKIKNNLLSHGFYAETIDKYYDTEKRGGLSHGQILEYCCINHQLIVFMDGDGSGTITEQNYLCDNYIFHGKTMFFIEESKFNKFKDDPSQYFKDFPTIITYKQDELLDKVLTFARFRLYRLAAIIKKQSSTGKGVHDPEYQSWKYRLGNRKR